jgi:hypothetical protein
MANIATVAVAAVVPAGREHCRVTGHGLVRALTRSYRGGYCVPTWAYDDYPRRCVYLQYGEKWAPSGVDLAWKRLRRSLRWMWVRWHDSGCGYDRIFRRGGDWHGTEAECRYGFDAVRLQAAEGFDGHSLGGEWRPAQPGVWVAEIRGGYFAGNDRSYFSGDQYPPRSRAGRRGWVRRGSAAVGSVGRTMTCRPS